jgi:hypothetical protein
MKLIISLYCLLITTTVYSQTGIDSVLVQVSKNNKGNINWQEELNLRPGLHPTIQKSNTTIFLAHLQVQGTSGILPLRSNWIFPQSIEAKEHCQINSLFKPIFSIASLPRIFCLTQNWKHWN